MGYLNNPNWFLFCDAIEKDNKSYDEAVQLLRDKGLSEEEIQAIEKQYQEWINETDIEEQMWNN